MLLGETVPDRSLQQNPESWSIVQLPQAKKRIIPRPCSNVLKSAVHGDALALGWVLIGRKSRALAISRCQALCWHKCNI